jgi:hypothetical protein
MTEGVAALLALLERIEQPPIPQAIREPRLFGRRNDRRHRTYIRRRPFGRDGCR